jgi:hypothetical protein
MQSGPCLQMISTVVLLEFQEMLYWAAEQQHGHHMQAYALLLV